MPQRKQYDNNLRGALFKNEDKKNDDHPDYRGQCEVDGTEYWLSAWIKTSKSGDKFMSLSLQVKEDRQQQRREPSRGGYSRDDRNDDRRGQQPSRGRNPDNGFEEMDEDIPF